MKKVAAPALVAAKKVAAPEEVAAPSSVAATGAMKKVAARKKWPLLPQSRPPVAATGRGDESGREEEVAAPSSVAANKVAAPEEVNAPQEVAAPSSVAPKKVAAPALVAATVAATAAFVLVLAPALRAPAAEDGAPAAPRLRIAVVQPGFPGSPRGARTFLDSLTRFLEGRTGTEAGSIAASYDNLPGDGLRALERDRPRIAIVSPGFYLEHRHTLGLRPLLEAGPPDRYYLVAPRGTPPPALAGRRVEGGAGYEPEFVRRLLFPAQGASEWDLAGTLHVTRSLRNLERGRVAAVLLHGREYRSLETLGSLKSLEKIAESDYYPPALLVACDLSRPPGAEPSAVESAVQAFARMAAEAQAGDREARDLLETMGCDGFRPARKVWLEALEKAYGGARDPQGASTEAQVKPSQEGQEKGEENHDPPQR